MLKLRKIAITGDIGSGKTMVCKIMEDFGAYVVSADELTHKLFVNDKECIRQVEALLGQEVKVNHQIDRKKVADLVFSDKKKLDQLEKILHPLVFKKMEALYKEACKIRQHGFFVVEIPLLFECGWEFFFDTVITITADEVVCRKRSLQKGLNDDDYSLRSCRLLPSEKKIKLSDFVIDNNDTVENLKKKITEIIKEIET